MRHARAYGLAGVAALVAAAVAFAQSTVEPLPDNPPVEVAPLDANAAAAVAKAAHGDVQRGATLAGTCAACHGLDGNPPEGMEAMGYPRLAGQSERYVAHQLALFKSGERANGMAAVMVPFAAPLSAQDMRDLGAYFATKTPGSGIADDTEVAEGPYAGMKFYEIGEKLFHQGDAARGLPACMACHGPAGQGNPGPAYPALAGQAASYMAARLDYYRSGTTAQQDRHLYDVMAAVAKSLTDEEIQAMASYLQGLHARPDAKTLAAIEAEAAKAPAPAPQPAPADAAGDAGDATDPDAPAEPTQGS